MITVPFADNVRCKNEELPFLVLEYEGVDVNVRGLLGLVLDLLLGEVVDDTLRGELGTVNTGDPATGDTATAALLFFPPNDKPRLLVDGLSTNLLSFGLGAESRLLTCFLLFILLSAFDNIAFSSSSSSTFTNNEESSILNEADRSIPAPSMVFLGGFDIFVHNTCQSP